RGHRHDESDEQRQHGGLQVVGAADLTHDQHEADGDDQRGDERGRGQLAPEPVEPEPHRRSACDAQRELPGQCEPLLRRRGLLLVDLIGDPGGGTFVVLVVLARVGVAVVVGVTVVLGRVVVTLVTALVIVVVPGLRVGGVVVTRVLAVLGVVGLGVVGVGVVAVGIAGVGVVAVALVVGLVVGVLGVVGLVVPARGRSAGTQGTADAGTRHLRILRR